LLESQKKHVFIPCGEIQSFWEPCEIAKTINFSISRPFPLSLSLSLSLLGLSVSMEQLGSHGTDIRKFWCLGIFSDIRREEVALKSAYSNGYFT